ncbi:unnamed protein product [Lupinus luteus]|uniref:Uncharacterized protein n=1 Tax=Lupinus luteus TaxID=3873 RepID=A0AAV1XPG7_LUPLU
MYKSCLRGPHPCVQGELTKVGLLSVENRLLHYLVVYILVQINTNHDQPTINDFKFMFAIKEEIAVNWHVEILKVMNGISWSSSRVLAYGIFISRVIDYLEIYTSDTNVIVTNSIEHLVGDNMIHKMGIYKYGNGWMYQEDYNTIVDLDLSDEEELASANEQNPERPQVEADNVPQVPSFGLGHWDAIEKWLNSRIDGHF